MIGFMFRLDVTSAQRPHRPEGVHHVIEGSAPGHRVGVPHQRLQVAGSADFLVLKQRPDGGAIGPVRQLVDFQVGGRSAGARDVDVQDDVGRERF